MTFKTVIIQFESPEEQQEFEKNCGLSIRDKETWDKDSGYVSWTEFNVEGFEPSDFEKYF